ncbi:hypothetical protein AWZ03_002951 [Drosophila navojoa]|uniref:Uncharacterized protein n=1 Tax=Drosophila navojoa TaxID=7232 RepID=A0A484BPF4_DRONA|nr:hypothetical protein AWZ03_002951 [Drosophila navojoa]
MEDDQINCAQTTTATTTTTTTTIEADFVAHDGDVSNCFDMDSHATCDEGNKIASIEIKNLPTVRIISSSSRGQRQPLMWMTMPSVGLRAADTSQQQQQQQEEQQQQCLHLRLNPATTWV